MTTEQTRVFELPAMPAVLPSFARAALSATRRTGPKVAIPDWSAKLASLSFDRKHLADYCRVCGIAPGATIPMLYPQALATPLFLHLMTRPGFPLPLMGLVHVRNLVEQERAIGVDETLDLGIRLAGSREVRSGLEIDLVIELADAEANVVWRATMTVLKRRASRDGGGKAPAAEAAPLAKYLRIDAPEDTGRRYAAVSQDFNPIHLYAGTAKLFGFPRAIAHGLWSAARVLGLLEAGLVGAPRRYEIQFRQPLLLPGRAALRHAETGNGIDFALLDARGARVHLTGSLR